MSVQVGTLSGTRGCMNINSNDLNKIINATHSQYPWHNFLAKLVGFSNGRTVSNLKIDQRWPWISTVHALRFQAVCMVRPILTDVDQIFSKTFCKDDYNKPILYVVNSNVAQRGCVCVCVRGGG